MLTFRDKYKYNVYSQNGEDGIIQEVVKRLGIKKGVAVEFGAADGYFCSNTRHLINQGWTGHLYDINPTVSKTEKPVKVQLAEITPENVNEWLPAECDVLSIDTDVNDAAIWEAYTGKAKVVIIEINSGIKPGSDSDNTTSFDYMVVLGWSKGYFLLCHTGNLIFIHDEYSEAFPEFLKPGAGDVDTYFDYSWCEAWDKHNAK